jgi:hypothetical protein
VVQHDDAFSRAWTVLQKYTSAVVTKCVCCRTHIEYGNFKSDPGLFIHCGAKGPKTIALGYFCGAIHIVKELVSLKIDYRLLERPSGDAIGRRKEV